MKKWKRNSENVHFSFCLPRKIYKINIHLNKKREINSLSNEFPRSHWLFLLCLGLFNLTDSQLDAQSIGKSLIGVGRG